MKSITPRLIALASALVFTCAHAQQTSTQASDSAANNSGLAQSVNMGGGHSSTTSLVFPSLIPGNVVSTGCMTSGVVTGAVGWNLAGGSAPVQLWSKECALPGDLKLLLDTCNYLAYKLRLDAHLLSVGVDLKAHWVRQRTGPQTYEEMVEAKYKDLSPEECLLLKNPPTAGAVPAAPVAVVTPPPAAPVAPAVVPMPAPTTATVIPVPITTVNNVERKVLSLASMSLFDTASARLKPAGERALTKALSGIDPANTKILKVEGRTDDRGADEYNRALSLARANTVAAKLRALGFTVLEVIGHGKGNPVIEGTDEGSRALNRSVTITLESVQVSQTSVTQTRAVASD
jgi:outer membrane protein OmpA-like peptidoglycan-associated protein